MMVRCNAGEFSTLVEVTPMPEAIFFRLYQRPHSKTPQVLVRVDTKRFGLVENKSLPPCNQHTSGRAGQHHAFPLYCHVPQCRRRCQLCPGISVEKYLD